MTYSTGPGALSRLGSACYRHRWDTVLVWIAGVAALITLWTRFTDLTVDNREKWNIKVG